MSARDTPPEVAALQIDLHRQFTPAHRLAQAIEMSEFARKLTRAGLRSRAPQLSDLELDSEMLNQLYGFHFERQ